MAKRTAASSQGNAATQAKQQSTASTTTRATRAQSREVSEPPASPRKRRAPAHSPDDEATQRPARRAKTSGHGGPSKDREQLQVVEEESDSESSASDNGSDDDGSIIHARSSLAPAREGSADESTESTTESVEEARNIDVNAISRTVELLNGAVDNLSALLLPADLHTQKHNWQALSVAGSSESRQLLREMKLFDMQKEELTGHTYIVPRIVNRAVLGEHYSADHPALPGLDAVLRRANLVKLLYDLLIVDGDNDGHRLDKLQMAEQMLAETMSDEENVGDLPGVLMKLKVQALIADLAANKAASAPAVLERHFGDVEGMSAADHFLQGLAPMYASAEDLGDDIQDNIDQIKLLIDASGTKKKSHPAAAVAQQYPWSRVQADLRTYAQRYSTQLARAINTIGGVHEIVAEIDQIVFSIAEANKGDQMHAQLVQGSAWEQQKPTKAALNALKRRKRAQEAGDGEIVQQGAPVANMISGPSPAARSASANHLEPQPRQAAFIDPNLDTVVRTPSKPKEASSAGSSKRLRPSRGEEIHAIEADAAEFQEIEPSQDNGFQPDARASSIADQRRQAQKNLSQAKNARLQAIQQARTQSTPLVASRSPNGRPAPPTKQPIDSNIAAADDDDDADNDDNVPSSTITNRLSVAKAQAARSNLFVRKTQDRKPWIEEENERLDELISNPAERNVPLSYKTLKEQDIAHPDGPKLGRRSKEDMRFRARNMKTKILRAGQTLPERWNQVILAKAQIAELQAYGIIYTNKESLEEGQTQQPADGDEEEE